MSINAFRGSAEDHPVRAVGMTLILLTALLVAFLGIRAISGPRAVRGGDAAPASIQGAQGVVVGARKQLRQSQARGQAGLDRAQPR